MEKAAGVLLAISSLPSKYGIGCFSKEAYRFVDWLKEAGQKYWQILPLGPTSYGDSPYQSFSTYAGNPYFIDLEQLIKLGLLTKEECDSVDFGDSEDTVDYKKMYDGRYQLLRKAYERSNIQQDREFHQFLDANKKWIYDYSLFMAIKNSFGGIAWLEWPENVKNREEAVLNSYREKLYFDIEFQQYMQYVFHQQWNELRSYANENGIKIIGDIPIYVALDSADTWAHPELFQLDEKHVPTAVAGCPPDSFSEDGQLWGNPLYRWDYHAETQYQWWIERLGYCFDLYDVVRIDHFRGFDQYYSIPYGDENAVNGHWEDGPGYALFGRMKEVLGERDVIAEDLGFVTDSVRQLVKDTEFPGMKVLEFAFDGMDANSAEYYPHRYIENSVAYTGTHDNETIIGWWKNLDEEYQINIRNYLCDQFTPDDYINEPLIGLIMRSDSKLCVVPMQDYLGLDNAGRMNTPSTLGGNWLWRVKKEQLTEKLQKRMYIMAEQFGRI